MKINILTFLLILAISLINYFCLHEYYISEILRDPLIVWLTFSLILLFRPDFDKKTALTVVIAISCGVIISALLGRNMTWDQYVLRGTSTIIGGLLLCIYVGKWKHAH